MIGQACSGPGTAYGPLMDTLLNVDTIVVGQFTELDDMNLNGIFRVQSYLMGESNSEYLVLALNPTWSIERRLQGRSVSGECTSVSAPFTLGETTVAFLKHYPDGAYRWIGVGDGFYSFPTAESKVTIFSQYPDSSQSGSWQDFSLSELLSYVEERTGQPARQPQSDDYPLTIPLMVLTESGSGYLVPVDGSSPTQLTDEEIERYRSPEGCSTPPCTAYSPNGLDTATLISQGEQLTVIPPGLIFQGDAVLFSPMSDILAFWNADQLEVYGSFAPQSGYEDRQLISTQQVDLPANRQAIVGQAAWSPDGRILAFSDKQGLWLWDVFSDTSRIIRTSNGDVIPIARSFSHFGRYLAVTEGDNRYHIDLVTGEQLPDGIISPNERTLFAFDTSTQGQFDIRIESLAPRGWAMMHPYNPVKQVEFVDENRHLAARCGDGYYPGDGEPYVAEPWCNIIEIYSQALWDRAFPGFAFDYHHQTDNIATVVDDKTITINGKSIDLSAYVDSPIVEIKWLRSLFYYS